MNQYETSDKKSEHGNGQVERGFGSAARPEVVDAQATENIQVEDGRDPGLEELIVRLLRRIGEDPGRQGLQRTPQRVSRSLSYLTSGYDADIQAVVNDALFDDDCDEMVVVRDVEFYSLCEHHVLPFFGRAQIGYIPDGKIIGLSKIARIVDVYARRLQVQERMTSQIADTLIEVLQPQGVAVVTEASHFCMMMRGVQKQNSFTIASAMRGTFKENARTRQEFMTLIG